MVAFRVEEVSRSVDAVEPPRPLSPQERRERNRQEMVTAILAAARAMMREQGVGALSLNEVARLVGLRGPALYEYFPSKTAVYDALFRLGTRLATEETERSILSSRLLHAPDHLAQYGFELGVIVRRGELVPVDDQRGAHDHQRRPGRW